MKRPTIHHFQIGGDEDSYINSECNICGKVWEWIISDETIRKHLRKHGATGKYLSGTISNGMYLVKHKPKTIPNWD